MGSGDLFAQPLGASGGLNWVFLIEVLLCGILSVFFLFYFNRVFATLISYAIRAYTWHAYKAYIDITSLQISLLGGRLFFKSLRYQAHNETILVHDGRITWRYWLRRVQDADAYRTAPDKSNGEEPSDADSSSGHAVSEKPDAGRQEAARIPPQHTLPCRLHVRVSGVEAFLYNHSPSYDHLMAEFEAVKAKKACQQNMHNSTSDDSPDTASDTLTKEKPVNVTANLDGADSVPASPTRNTLNHKRRKNMPGLPSYLCLFPIQVECRKAAAAVGNEHTKSVIVAKAQEAEGRIDAAQAGPLDLFKLLFLFNAENVSISLRNNEDYKETQFAAASRTEQDKEWTKRRKRSAFSIFRPIRVLTRRLRRSLPWIRHSSASVRASSIRDNSVTSEVNDPLFIPEPWHGLARFLDTNDGSPANEWDDVEYARLSSLADFDKLSLKFFWDIPGPVRDNAEDAAFDPLLLNDANGSKPPDYGLELTFGDGVVNYGPWTDRERVVLQSVFFPPSLVDARPLEALKPGQPRLSTVFNMTFLVEGTVTVRIPTRESSKDWRHQHGHASADASKNRTGLRKRAPGTRSNNKLGSKVRQDPVAKDKRPFGWMDITVAKDTTVNYAMDMYARSDGFHNSLRVQVKQPRISTSVNHDMLWESGDVIVNGDLSNPLEWNTLRTWKFKISCDDLDLYILRDHMFLLTDVITDWSSGPPPQFHTFVPYRYELEADFRKFDLILSANDANLINRPTDLEDNNFLILKGESLHVDFSIPLEFYCTDTNTFTFDVSTRHLTLDLLNPARLTLHELLQPKRVGVLPHLTLKGSMTVNAEQSPELTDILQMEICGTELDLIVHGFLLRYFVNFKENYFGEHLHFRTFEEYQATNGDTSFAVLEEIKKYRFRRSNDLDVILSIIVERPTLKLPANLYSADSYIKVELPIADVDLRVTNYYLDLQVDISPASFTYVLSNDKSEALPSEEQMRIESVTVTGHRLFGLPPTEPAYVSTWDIGAGRISGRCSTDFVHQLTKSGQSLAFAIEDGENALPDTEAIEINDMIFLQVHTAEVQLAMDVADTVVSIQFDPVALRFDDAADARFSSRLSTRIPGLTVSCTTAETFNHSDPYITTTDASRHLCFIQTTVDLSLVTRKKGFQQERLAQQKHVTKHDVRTDRARFLIDNALDNLSVHSDDLPIERPAMPAPGLPWPAKNKSNFMPTNRKKGSSLRRPINGTGIHSKGISSSHMPLMSAYIAPTTLNLAGDFPDVPGFLAQDPSDSPDIKYRGDMDLQDTAYSRDEAQQTLLIRLTPGVRALMRPEFLEVATRITDSFVPSKDVDLMDSIHLSVLKVVQDAAATRQGQSSAFNLQIAVPSLHLRTVIETGKASQINLSKHQLDLTLHHLTTALRIRNVAENDGLQKVAVLHTTVQTVSLELVTNTASRSLTIPDIHLDVEDILVWANLADVNVVDLSFKVLAMSVSAFELRDTTLALIEIFEKGISMYEVVSRIDETYNIRMRQLLSFISQKHSGPSDPLYLSRMTYVLRSFPDHLRNQDSWKMLARIRHIHATLTPEQHKELEAILEDPCEPHQRRGSIPLQDVLSWCSWDIPAPQETAMYHYVSGKPSVVEDATQQTPLRLSLRSGLVRLQVGPSTRGSEFSIADLSIDVNVQPPSEPAGLMLVEDNIRTLVTVVSRSSAIFLRLKWDLVEAVMPVLDAIELSSKAFTHSPQKSKLSNFDFPATRDDLQLFFSTDDGTVMIDTINLQHISAVRDLQLSAISTSRVGHKYADCMCLLIGADQATTELHNHGIARQRIWRTNLTKPSIYLDVRQRLQSSVVELNVGGTYGDMVIAVEQEPIAFMATIDRILIDEAIQIRAIKDRVTGLFEAPTTVLGPLPEQTPTKTLEINAALLAGAFNVNIAVLKSLVMNIRGKVANVRVKPRGHEHSTLDIELDVGPVRYAALSKESGLVGEEALFHTPSAGTSIEVDLGPAGGRVKVSSTIQEMLIEASAVQNIINLIRRQEVQGVLEALDNGISEIKIRMTDLLGTPKVEKRNEPLSSKPPIKYNVDVTLAGFRVVAKAPVQEAGYHSAELVFGLGLIQCAVNNGYHDQNLGADLPEIYARISSIFATLDLISNEQRTQCGHVKVGLLLRTKQSTEPSKSLTGDVFIMSDSLDVEVSADTASTIVDIITHVQKKLVDLDLSKEVEYLRKLRPAQRKVVQQKVQSQLQPGEFNIDTITSLAPSNLVISLNHIRFAWITTRASNTTSDWRPEDLELSLGQVEFSVKQRNRAQLKIDSLLLQMMPSKNSGNPRRSPNSALLPEMVFIVRFETRDEGLCLAFQAVGQALDVTLDADFAGPLGLLVTSGCMALDKYREASKNWSNVSKSEIKESSPRKIPFGTIRLASLLMDLNFAGVLIHLRGKPVIVSSGGTNFHLTNLASSPNSQENAVRAEFRAPGFAMKLEYLSDQQRSTEPRLTGEIKVDASSNTVYPDLVPIILQISENAQRAMQTAEASEKHQRETNTAKKQAQRNTMISLPDENLLNSNELLARTQISIGIRILAQEFGLSCQPFAKVNATARFDNIYMSFNTIDAASGQRFVAVSSNLTNLRASVQHIYSRESTFSFEMEAVHMSVMNCKNKNDEPNGISAIVKVEPMKTMVNARQMQDLLLFREIWLPEQIRMQQELAPKMPLVENNDEFLVERYRQVAAAAAFPWNATVSLTEIEVDIDFGQSIGKSSINLKNSWATSTKTSGWKQELCLGIEEVKANSVGRMGGFIELSDLRLRTLIEWPLEHLDIQRTPLIQATVGFEELRVKAAFDYQPFAFAELGKLSFIMFNVRDDDSQSADRLVTTLDLGHIYAYIVASSPAQAFGLYQAFDRLIQEKQAAFRQSIADLQKQLKRPSIASQQTLQRLKPLLDTSPAKPKVSEPIKLRTDVLVRIQTINVGVFPGTFFDGQVLKLEATGGQARFLVDVHDSKIHSNLGLVLGQLQVALASPKRVNVPKTLGDIPIEEVIQNGGAAKGGIILRVPRLVATMQTWQPPQARVIDYIFKSTFEGKVDVGWNYSRISFIRTMWSTHSRSLAARLGKPLPESAVRITTEPDQKDRDKSKEADKGEGGSEEEQGKITAVVTMPLSRYEYKALEPPVIETPQLRDMGEATPPLEWIGLQRDKLPNVVHQVVIVTLLELAKEVEDAYARILGSS